VVKNKVFIMIIAVLIAITLILTAAFLLWNYMENDNQSVQQMAQTSANEVKPGKKLTADQIKENTVIIKDILTNLNGKDKFIKVSFAFELENKKAKEEFEKLDFKMKAIIIQTLADMTPEQIQGSQGVDQMNAALMNKINKELTLGKLREIWITDKVLQ
jgi:flagellar FliL protein